MAKYIFYVVLHWLTGFLVNLIEARVSSICVLCSLFEVSWGARWILLQFLEDGLQPSNPCVQSSQLFKSRVSSLVVNCTQLCSGSNQPAYLLVLLLCLSEDLFVIVCLDPVHWTCVFIGLTTMPLRIPSLIPSLSSPLICKKASNSRNSYYLPCLNLVWTRTDDLVETNVCCK